MEIKRAANHDIDQVLKLLRDQFIEHNIEFDNFNLKRALEHLIEDDEKGFALLAREADLAVGFAAVSFAWTLEHGGKSAWLDELYVIHSRRGRGIGTLLIEVVEREAVSEGCLALDLEVDSDHRRAEELYERLGFLNLHRRRWVKHLDNMKSH